MNIKKSCSTCAYQSDACFQPCHNYHRWTPSHEAKLEARLTALRAENQKLREALENTALAAAQRVHAAIASYRSAVVQDEEGNGYELSDILAAAYEDKTIKTALTELALLGDHIYCEILQGAAEDRAALAADPAPKQEVCEWKQVNERRSTWRTGCGRTFTITEDPAVIGECLHCELPISIKGEEVEG